MEENKKDNWKITIDDGHCAYEHIMTLSDELSIQEIADHISTTLNGTIESFSLVEPTRLLSENKRLKEALGEILSAFDKFKVSGPHLEENPFYTLRKTDLEGIIGKAPVTTVNPDNDDMR